MDATATCDYEHNYHHQCHMSAEMRFSQCLTKVTGLIASKGKGSLGSARAYNELVQMLYNITYSQTHESLLPEKDDVRAFTRFAEHQANYNVACHAVCFPRIYITTNGPPRNGLCMPTHY